LHLPAETRRPVQIAVMVNLTPSERLAHAQQVPESNLGALLPALKVISQMAVRNGSLSVALLDLARRRVTFHQEDIHNLDWPALKASLKEADAGTIDVKSLEDRHHKVEFFEAEVSRRIGPVPKEKSSGGAAPARVLIVLSNPVEFESGEDLQPIRLAPEPDCRVFYIRYHPHIVPLAVPLPALARGRRQRPGLPPPVIRETQIDQLAPTLKPLGPQLFDVETPEQFRKALATTLAGISSL
jgi:Cu/Ag efflux protein CusF